MSKILLDRCVIHVTDWNRSNHFYHDVLNAELVQVDSGWVYRFGKQQLNIHGSGKSGTPVAKIPVPPGGSDLCFEWVGSIEEAQEHLDRYGVSVEIGSVNCFGAKGNGTSIYFRDPDGSLLEFISYQ